MSETEDNVDYEASSSDDNETLVVSQADSVFLSVNL